MQAQAIYHLSADGRLITRTYAQFAERACGFGYYLLKHGYKRVGILASNTPGFLDAIYGIGAAGAVQVGINYRLKSDDLHYIFDHAEVDCIVVDREYVNLLKGFNPKVPLIVDEDTDGVSGQFDRAIAEGLEYNRSLGGKGWDGLHAEAADETQLIALAYTSGTTSRPKGVELTHRGAYLAAISNIIESGLNVQSILSRDRCKYLSILPFFHACGWTFVSEYSEYLERICLPR